MRRRLSAATIDTLAAHVPRDSLERMRVLTGRPWHWLPALIGMSAITFGDHVLFRHGRFNESSTRGLALIAHESIHIAQYRRYGRLGMSLRYLWGQLRCGFQHDRHPLERPCIEAQRIVRALLERQRYV